MDYFDHFDSDLLYGWYEQGLNFSNEYATHNTLFNEQNNVDYSQMNIESSQMSIVYSQMQIDSSQDSTSFDGYSNSSFIDTPMSSFSTMGQESSQIAPTAANPPASKFSPRIQSSPSPPKASFGGWTAVNAPSSSSQLQSAFASSYPRSDPNSNKRKRVREALSTPATSPHPPVPAFTRPPRVKIPSESPSPPAASVPSPAAETSIQATSPADSPRSDASNDLDRSPLSSQESVTEESEPATPTEAEADPTPTPKRQKISPAPSSPATPTAPVTAGRRRSTQARGSAARPRTRAPRPSPAAARPPPVLAAPSRPGSRMEGRYTLQELQILENTVHAYRDENNHTQYELNKLLNSNARTNDFPGGLWDYICNALPNRERHSIQKAVKRKFNNLKRGAWKPEDDEELCELYRLYPNKWQKIGDENNRGAEASRDRWRNYCKNGEAQEKGEWPKEQEDLLAKLMRQTVKLLVDDRLREIRAGRLVPPTFEPAELMDYGILSEQMGGTRSRLQCRNKFEKFKARDDARMEFIFKPLEDLEGIEFEASSSPTRARPRSAPMVTKSKARVSEESEALDNYKKMLIGDRYYILTCISRAMVKSRVTDEESIPWEDIYMADSKTDWSILDRKVVLRQMKEEFPVPDEPNCLEIVDGIIEILEADFDEDELEKHYVDRPHSAKKQRTYTKKGSRARKIVSAIKVTEEEDDDSPARSLPTPGSMEEDDDEEEGV